MEDLVQMIIADESPSQISDAIKAALHDKAMEKIDAFRPEVAANLFNVNEE